MSLEELKQKVLSGKLLSSEEALYLLQVKKESLYEAAHTITRHFMGQRFDTCSIVNARSGNCSEDCKWCAQSAYYSTKVQLYPLLSQEECVHQAIYNWKCGIGRFALVTSGKRVNTTDMERITRIIKAIKDACPIKCCASMGLLNWDELYTLRESGVENYHCNIETAPSYFPQLCTTHTLAQKIETIRMARELGFRICSGGIIGMGETSEQRVEMALFLQQLDIRSIPINLLQPIPGTPLAHTRPMKEEDLLTTIAIFRMVNPQAYLRFSGGRAQLSESIQRKALYIGINAAIIGDLLTTVGSRADEDKQLFTSEGYVLTEQTDWKG